MIRHRASPSPLASLLPLLALALAACGTPERVPQRVDTYILAEGTYRTAYSSGYAPADEAKVLAVTAQLDRTAGRLVLTLADGSTRALTFAPRPAEQWLADCYTMISHSLNEIADLTPAPLVVESLTFSAPVVHAECGPSRIILREAGDATGQAPGARWLALDRQ